MTTKPTDRPGFSLLEVLLALAVSGGLLLAATAYLVSVADLWFNENDTEYFDRHVEGVVTFLEEVISKAEVETESESGEETQPVSWMEPPGASQFDDPRLSVFLRETPPVLRIGEVSLPGVRIYLVFDRQEGIGVLWNSRLERPENLQQLRFTVISPYVREMLYCYYDEDNDSWEDLDSPRQESDGQYVLPNFLKLTFVHPEFENEQRQIAVFLPERGQNALFF